MAEDIPKSKSRSFDRHLRAETVVVNGTTIIFYRDRKKRRWNWRVLDAEVTLPASSNANSTGSTNHGPKH